MRRASLQSVDRLVEELLQNVTHALRLRAGERIAVLLNNLGASTSMELAIAARRTLAYLQARELTVERFFSGTFLSSLNMEGISLSLMRVNDEQVRRLDAPTAAPAWPNAPRTAPGATLTRIFEEPAMQVSDITPSISEAPQTQLGKTMQAAVRAASQALLAAESRLTEMDQAVGDGDLGYNLARAAREVLGQLDHFPFDHPGQALKSLGVLLQDVLGGSSGPLYSALLIRTGISLEANAGEPGAWAAALVEGCGAIGELGGARLGDRTMLDALVPFTQTFAEATDLGASRTEALAAGVEAAQNGAAKTAYLVARRGRSSYIGERSLGTPDPGATAVAIWLEAVVSALSE